MRSMDAGTIREWVTIAEADLAELTAEAERVQRRIAQARMQLNLMYELLATLTNEPMPQRRDVEGAVQPVRERVVAAVVRILHDHGRPMRIQDIHGEFMRRELPLPGSGTPANIAAHLVDRDLFTRHRRGVFGLAVWDNGVPAANTAGASTISMEESGSV